MLAHSCPSCSQRLLASPERAGERTTCPKCLGTLTVPDPNGIDVDHFPAGVDTPLPVAFQDVTLALAGVAVGEAVREDDFEVPAVARPASDYRTARSAPGPTSRKPLADDNGRVILTPTGLFAVDIAAELSATISLRMAPPPEPVSDRQVTMAVWLIGTAVAGLLWLAAVVTAPELFPFVALLGGAMAAFGYLWRAYLAGLQQPANGFVTLLPPVGLARLFAPTPAHGLRPLRFALTGAAFLGLFVLGPTARAMFDEQFGVRVEPATPVVVSPVANFRTAVAEKRYAEALVELGRFPGKDAVSDEQKPGVIGDLLVLTTADRADVRTAAMTVLAEFAPADCKAAARVGLKSADGDERRAACKVADRVLGAEAAGDLAERLGDRVDRPDAKAALLRLGTVAEAAVLPLLKSDREPVALVACEVLERIGGAKAEVELRALADAAKSRAVRQEASQAAEVVAERLKRGK